MRHSMAASQNTESEYSACSHLSDNSGLAEKKFF